MTSEGVRQNSQTLKHNNGKFVRMLGWVPSADSGKKLRCVDNGFVTIQANPNVPETCIESEMWDQWVEVVCMVTGADTVILLWWNTRVPFCPVYQTQNRLDTRKVSNCLQIVVL